jgi:SAM-dependent methyltransferase
VSHERILREVASYYSGKLREHGPTPKGVDWNGEESQTTRFAQITRVIDREPFSILDVGCGYGALADFLAQRYRRFRYTGYDVSADMMAAARERHRDQEHVTFATEWNESAHDYVVASGIFNVRLRASDEDWRLYIFDTLQKIDACARRGWAANFLTIYSDREYMRDYLYYADPCMLFDWAKRNASKQVALLHDYGLYEFTLLVRKDVHQP